MRIECPKCLQLFEADKMTIICADWRVQCPHCKAELEIEMGKIPNGEEFVSKEFVKLRTAHKYPMKAYLERCSKCKKAMFIEIRSMGSNHIGGWRLTCWDCLTPIEKGEIKEKYNITAKQVREVESK